MNKEQQDANIQIAGNTFKSVILRSKTSRIEIRNPERTVIPKTKLFQKK
jgi:hypothetical protein